MKKLLVLLTISTIAHAGWHYKVFNNKTGKTVTLLIVVKDPEGSRTFQIRDQNSAPLALNFIDKKKHIYETLQSMYVTAPGNRVVTLDVEGGNKVVNPYGLTLVEAVDGYDIVKQ